MPVCNAERSVAAAVESVLRQSFGDFELLAIDDGSTDASGRILRSFRDSRIRIIDRHCNRGLVAVLNDALQEATGEFVARHDADDVSLPERFALQRAVLDAQPEIGAVGAALQLVHDGGARGGTWTYPDTSAAARWQALFKTPVAHSVVMYRRRCVLEVGGYSEEFKYAEDYDLWSRLLKVAEITSLSTCLLRYSLGAEGVSRAKSREQQAVHCRIAARNMAELLGREVPLTTVRTLAIDLDLRETLKSYTECVSAGTTCAALFAAFIDRVTERTDVRAVSADCCDRYLQLVRLLPYRLRPRALLELRALAPRGAIGLRALVKTMARP
jgi:glycosyltransferase involved in cell wall biosynthesis